MPAKARQPAAAAAPKPHPLPGAPGPATASGAIAAAQDAVSLLVGDQGSVTCQVTGTWSATLIFEGTVDNTNWATIRANALATDTLVTTTTTNGIFLFMAGMTAVRVRCSAWVSGTATVTLRATPGTAAVLPVSAAAWGAPVLGAGTNAIGSVGGFSAAPLVTLTRPANTTAYTAQDEVATAGTAPVSFSVARVTGQSGIVTGADLIYSNNPSTTPSFRLLLFSATVTAAGDNVALALSDADAALFIGIIDFSSTQAGGSATSANLMMSGAAVNAKPFTTDTIFGLLITTNAFTPIANSETVKIRLNLEQN